MASTVKTWWNLMLSEGPRTPLAAQAFGARDCHPPPPPTNKSDLATATVKGRKGMYFPSSLQSADRWRLVFTSKGKNAGKFASREQFSRRRQHGGELL